MDKRIKYFLVTLAAFLTGWMTLTSCARMGNPDGGWYDEEPPRVVSASPADRGTDSRPRKVVITFDEFVKLENATEKVVISPPQLEQPEIKATGKKIIVELKDSLKENTTYTIDFSDAISDNNEGNPMGNYTYSFSTGKQIDTLEVSGTVLNAENLEPVKGTLVGLYRVDSIAVDSLKRGCSFDSLNAQCMREPIQRVSRTDSHGRFIIRGIAPGTYRVIALTDIDNNFFYSQAAEAVAFDHEFFVPSCRPDQRPDTIWADSLHIRDIKMTPYTHFLPDDIVLRQFVKEQKDRFFLKTERTDARLFKVFFSGPSSKEPVVKGLNFDSDSAFIIESTPKNDTITYWLRDTALVNQDTLEITLSYEATDSLGKLMPQTDTLKILAKEPYAKRMKTLQKEMDDWYKKLEKKRKKATEEITDTIFPVKRLEPVYGISNTLSPDGSLTIDFPTPLTRLDSAAIHLYIKQDTLWYNAPFKLQQREFEGSTPRNMEIIAEWEPDAEYSFEVDTLAFEDIYGLTSKPHQAGFKVNALDTYSTLFVKTVYDGEGTVIVQLIDGGEKLLKEAHTVDGTAEFYYVTPGDYYLRAFVDLNGNGIWDTGNFEEDRQPEEVYYYPEKVTCKAKWDVTREWVLKSRPIDKQKPDALIKQKGDAKKSIRLRNAERAKEKGIPLPDNLKK